MQDGTGLYICPEFRVSVRSSELDQVNPGSAGSLIGERTGYNPGLAGPEFGERPVPFSKLRTLTRSEFGERTRPNLVLAGSQKGQFLCPNS